MQKKKDKAIKAALNARDEQETEAAMTVLNELIEGSSRQQDLFFARAELFYKLNRYGDAINDYLRVLEINPEHKEAIGKIDILKTILRYNNTDIYASPNTDMDPWLE